MRHFPRKEIRTQVDLARTQGLPTATQPVLRFAASDFPRGNQRHCAFTPTFRRCPVCTTSPSDNFAQPSPWCSSTTRSLEKSSRISPESWCPLQMPLSARLRPCNRTRKTSPTQTKNRMKRPTKRAWIGPTDRKMALVLYQAAL